jgi:hypothetical protein
METLLVFVVYLIGWGIHRNKKATGWISASQRAGDENAGYRAWWKKNWAFTSGEFGFQCLVSLGWAAGMFRSALIEAIPEKWVTTDQTGILVQAALAGLGGYCCGSAMYEWKARRETKANGEKP